MLQCELVHWIDVLDRFDSILEEVTKHEENDCVFMCPKLNDKDVSVCVCVCVVCLCVHPSFISHPPISIYLSIYLSRLFKAG